MSKVWPLEIIKILEEGYSLDEIGVENWAFRKPDALIAINKLSKIGVPVLKGDVFELIEGSIENNYDGWQCYLEKGESISDFIARSAEKAIDYIEDYPTDSTVLFVLTPGI